MTPLATLMTNDHRACDHALASAEKHVLQRNWPAARLALGRFADMLSAHFDAEEQTLFPRFEAATGMTGGPTAVMRAEHAEMRILLDNLQAAIDGQDGDEFAGEAETLLIMIQQHNMKEENILYPICDARLAEQAGELVTLLAEQLGQRAATEITS
ncbi:hemerythrin domain-containing protein [Parazoarcus communis]|uniref:Hemerythrin domain-containing protein n=1 Tax=Parazoarcus communis SWub3 = DSM 12120 TaxID=1121029 RepID=A0A323UV04_9RHOO|nr:hemerythrin domain-containing protein [Parazoarcus communis]NMG72810.1 hemerythrin domain-containing protein [Parazoarcus communis SWub3 = DSM 12120]PZA16277.1 hemerythrin domain-containing protein [Azoarcus communis] [Parazoarcus communis SWub3 = DSM 12120]